MRLTFHALAMPRRSCLVGNIMNSNLELHKPWPMMFCCIINILDDSTHLRGDRTQSAVFVSLTWRECAIALQIAGHSFEKKQLKSLRNKRSAQLPRRGNLPGGEVKQKKLKTLEPRNNIPLHQSIVHLVPWYSIQKSSILEVILLILIHPTTYSAA